MINKLHLITVSDYVDPHQMWMRICPDGINFNSKSAQKLQLHTFSSVRFYADTEDLSKMGKLYIEPNNDSKSLSNWRFTLDRTRLKRKSISGRFAPSRPFIDRNPRLKKISQSQQNYQRRLQIEFDKIHNLYYCVVAPCFEETTNINKQLEDLPVIYSLHRKNGDCVNIGETNSLKRRMREHLRDHWDFFRIDFSQIEDTEKRKEWETYHLDQYKQEHGCLPFYNRQLGKSFANVVEINDHEHKTLPNGQDHFEEMLPVEGETEQ
mgnify:FL=1